MEPAFRFCPACGGRLPAFPEEEEEETEQAAPAPPRQQAGSPAAAAASPPPAPARPSVAARPSSRSPRKPRAGPAVPLPVEAVLTDRGGRQWRLVRLLEQGGCGLVYEGAVGAGEGRGAAGEGRAGACPRRLGRAPRRDPLSVVAVGMSRDHQNPPGRCGGDGTVWVSSRMAATVRHSHGDMALA